VDCSATTYGVNTALLKIWGVLVRVTTKGHSVVTRTSTPHMFNNAVFTP